MPRALHDGLHFKYVFLLLWHSNSLKIETLDSYLKSELIGIYIVITHRIYVIVFLLMWHSNCGLSSPFVIRFL